MTATLVAPRPPKVSGIPTSGIIVIAGEPKAGKTTFGASFPDSYVLELDKKDADRVGGRIHDIEDLDQYGEVLQLAIADSSIRTIVVDTVTTLGQWMEASVAKAGGVEFLGKPTQGVDQRGLWGELFENWKGMVEYLKNCGKLVILIAHVKEAEKDDKGRITKPAGIKVRGAGADHIIEQADAIGHMRVKVVNDTTYHYLSFKAPSDEAIWRSRIKELQGKEFLVPEADPYAAFVEQFNEQPKPAAPAALKPVATNGHRNGHRAPAKPAGRKR